MKLKDDLSRITSNGFIIAMIIFTVLLSYMSIQAKKVADKWEEENNRAIEVLLDL
jgi:regulatory protein YycI of two-component signal transduction system YycFG